MTSRRLLDSGWLLVLHFLAMVAPRDGVSLKMPPKKRVLDKTAVGAFKAGVNIFQLPRKARKSRHAAHERGSPSINAFGAMHQLNQPLVDLSLIVLD